MENNIRCEFSVAVSTLFCSTNYNVISIFLQLLCNLHTGTHFLEQIYKFFSQKCAGWEKKESEFISEERANKSIFYTLLT